MKKTLIIAAICGIAIVVGVVVCLSSEKTKKDDVKEQQPEVKEPDEELKCYNKVVTGVANEI